MPDREETLLASTRAELEAALRALGHDVRATPVRRARGGGWYARVHARPPAQLAPPSAAGLDRVPRVLWVAMGVGFAAAVVLGVLAVAWAVNHWAWVLLGLLAAGWIARMVRRS